MSCNILYTRVKDRREQTPAQTWLVDSVTAVTAAFRAITQTNTWLTLYSPTAQHSVKNCCLCEKCDVVESEEDSDESDSDILFNAFHCHSHVLPPPVFPSLGFSHNFLLGCGAAYK